MLILKSWVDTQVHYLSMKSITHIFLHGTELSITINLRQKWRMVKGFC